MYLGTEEDAGFVCLRVSPCLLPQDALQSWAAVTRTEGGGQWKDMEGVKDTSHAARMGDEFLQSLKKDLKRAVRYKESSCEEKDFQKHC